MRLCGWAVTVMDIFHATVQSKNMNNSEPTYLHGNQILYLCALLWSTKLNHCWSWWSLDWHQLTQFGWGGRGQGYRTGDTNTWPRLYWSYRCRQGKKSHLDHDQRSWSSIALHVNNTDSAIFHPMACSSLHTRHQTSQVSSSWLFKQPRKPGTPVNFIS